VDPLAELEATVASPGEATGERLVALAEAAARSAPAALSALAERLDGLAPDPALGPFAEWAAGVALHLGGEPGRAEPRLRRARRRFAARRRSDLADRAGLLLVDVLAELRRVEPARRLARQLARRFAARGDGARAAAALANLACAEDAVDRVAAARRLWRRAARRLAPGDPRRLLVEGNLANVAALAGHLGEAISGHRRVAAAARAAGREALAVQAEANLAEALYLAGRVDEALQLWARVLEAARRCGARSVELTATVDLAEAELELGLLDAAGGRLAGLLPRLEEAGLGREAVRVRRLLAGLSAAAGDRRGWRREAERLRVAGDRAGAALAVVGAAWVDPTVGGRELAAAAGALARLGLGAAAALARAHAAARAARGGEGRRARRIARRVLADRAAGDLARMLAHRALATAEPRSRLRHLGRAARLAERQLGRLRAPADREGFLTHRGEVLLELVEALLERGRSDDRRRALGLLARLRSGCLVEELARRLERAGDPVVARWTELRRRLAVLLDRLEGEDGPRLRHSGLRLEAELERFEREVAAAERELARRWPELGWDGAGAVARRLLDALPADHVYLELVLLGDDLVALVGRRGRLTAARRVGVGPRLAELVRSIRFHVDAYGWLDGEERAASASVLGRRLAAVGELLSGLLPAGGWATVWLAPSGALHHLPWGAVPVDGVPLAERGVVTVVPGAAAAAALLGGTPEAPRRPAVAGAAVAGLPLVERELAEVAKAMPGAEVRRAATREELLALLAGHDLVHLAGHSVFLDRLPSASGLRLADGFVTVHDLAARRLAARTVVLGVCAAARVAEGAGFGYDGFLRALLAGGVRTVVGAITAVRDESAYRFGVAFHAALAVTRDPGTAWRRAVAAVRAAEPSPAAWGAFHLVGDPRPWRG